jgi:hypothetical protein
LYTYEGSENIEPSDFVKLVHRKGKYFAKLFKVKGTFSSSSALKEFLAEIKSNRIKEFSSILELQDFNDEEWSRILTYIHLCKQYDIPFSTFDNIRAASSSDSLVAKLYIFLILFSSNNEDFFNTCTKIEDDLGFRFQWSSYDEFEKWITDAECQNHWKERGICLNKDKTEILDFEEIRKCP